MRLFDDGALPDSAVPGLAFLSFPSPSATQAIALLSQLEATQWWPADRLREHQLRQLELLLRHAVTTTARGRDELRAWGSGPLTWERWANLPRLTREQLQRRPDRLRSDAPPPSHGPIGTSASSGSTSTPVVVDRTAITGVLWHAVHARDHLWHGRDGRAGLAVVRHAPEAPGGRTRSGWDPVLSALGQRGPCHILHIGASTAEQLTWLRALPEPAYLLMYPSSLRDLLALSPARPVPGLRAILTFGEVVDDGLRSDVLARWGLPVQDVYSTQEVGYLALQCPDHGAYHVQSETVLVEVLRDDGSPCAVGELGQVVVTALQNFVMPLIRYELGDLAVPGPPCACGRGLPTLERIAGRVHETFETRSGERIWLTVGVHLLPSLGPVAQHQFVQHEPGKLQARFVPHRPPTPSETEALRAHLMARLPAGTELEITWVDRIERTKQGKFLSFVSTITR